ncbi:MAG TPA: hypothetical protein VFZ63_09965 [Jiangellaceae bacterium]
MNRQAPPRFGPSLRGALTVAAHEFRLRIRAGRWRWLLGAWFLSLFALTAGIRSALVRGGQTSPGTDMFGGLMLTMLALALLVVPALTAQSVNGDRLRGLLATLQTTLLTPAEIAIGKLAAAWGTAIVFLITAVPLALWCVAEGASALRVAVSLGITAVLLGVICSICLCLSAVLARTTTSGVLSYLAVFALSIGTVIVFVLAVAATQTTETRTTAAGTFEHIEAHPDRVWWLLAPNPFVVVADAAPRALDRPDAGVRLDPLGAIGEVARSARTPGSTVVNPNGIVELGQAAVWPYGLATNIVLGLGALVITTRRLRTPYTKLPKSVRVG